MTPSKRSGATFSKQFCPLIALILLLPGCASDPVQVGPYSRAAKTIDRKVEVDLGNGEHGTINKSEVDLDDYIALINSVPIKNLDKPPKPLAIPSPYYPPALRRQRIQGYAEVYMIVDERGMVEKATVKAATRPEFGRAAVEAVLSWRFEPMTRQGKPTKAALLQRFPFELQ